MEKQLVVCASPQAQKYYFEPTFNDMPQAIREELTAAIARIAEKTKAVISLGFYEDGNFYIEKTEESDVFADEIGIELEIKQFQKEKAELLKSLRLWYMIYRTEEGQLVKEVVLYQAQGLSTPQIVEKIAGIHGETGKKFAEALLGDA